MGEVHTTAPDRAEDWNLGQGCISWNTYLGRYILLEYIRLHTIFTHYCQYTGSYLFVPTHPTLPHNLPSPTPPPLSPHQLPPPPITFPHIRKSKQHRARTPHAHSTETLSRRSHRRRPPPLHDSSPPWLQSCLGASRPGRALASWATRSQPSRPGSGPIGSLCSPVVQCVGWACAGRIVV